MSEAASGTPPVPPADGELVRLDNGTASIGVDRAMGGSITWLSWRGHPKNVVNIHDPGRLIQQSYYAGQSVDRTTDGQHERWSPWAWNPIQAGGVGSWARVTKLEQKPGEMFCETIPKLWDMPNEEAAAVMRQWTAFEPGMPDVIVVRCEFESRREAGDRWGTKPIPRKQELPACYFTRSFRTAKSYLGSGKWRDENPALGPPWSKVTPPQKVVACFNTEGQGVAIFSPSATDHWNYGPVGQRDSDDPRAGPCMHVAPLATLRLGPQCRLRYRYWLVVGTAESMAPRLDALLARYGDDTAAVTDIGPAANAEAIRKRPQRRPNMIVIYTDDHGYADLSCMGHEKDVKTPHIDALAAQGVRFTSGYVTAPQCCPSRAGLLTGRDQNRFGLVANGHGPLPLGETTIADRLDHQTEAALRFIDIHHAEPFFLYLAYYGPHVPLASSKKYLDRFRGPMPERRRYALAMISAIDDGVGRIMKSLAEHGIGENTIIFCISDSGAPLKLTMPDDPVSAEGPTWDGSKNTPLSGKFL
jgi:hypothetical protein